MTKGSPHPSILEAATAAKRPRGRPKVNGRPPPDTQCRVQFAPSPHGTLHIRTIKGGAAALDAFLLAEKIHPPEPPPGHTEPTGRDPRDIPGAESAAPHPKRKLSTPPPQGPAHRRQPPSSPARPVRRTHTTLLHFITEEGDPDRDSIPRKDLTSPSYPHHPHGTNWEWT